MLRLLFLPSDVGTLDGIIGDSTHSVDNLYEPASQPFGPFDLEEGDRIDITTNVAFDAFLEVKADPLLRNGRFPDFSELSLYMLHSRLLGYRSGERYLFSIPIG